MPLKGQNRLRLFRDCACREVGSDGRIREGYTARAQRREHEIDVSHRLRRGSDYDDRTTEFLLEALDNFGLRQLELLRVRLDQVRRDEGVPFVGQQIAPRKK